MNARAPPKMDPTFEVVMVMNLDAKYPDQQIRTSIKLPHGTGKSVNVAVFCPNDEEEEILAMGAYKAGATLAKDIEEENIDFDVLIAKPQMMPRLAKLGRILGPRRLMPSPKSGTVVTDYKEAIEDFKAGGTIEVRTSFKSTMDVPIASLTMGKQ